MQGLLWCCWRAFAPPPKPETQTSKMLLNCKHIKRNKKSFCPLVSWRRVVAGGVLAAAGGGVWAAPFAISYDGVIAGSSIPGVHNGQRYQITLVMDNGGAQPSGQLWQPQHLTCTLWRMNDAATVAFAQNLSVVPRPSGYGSVATSAAGTLVGVFQSLRIPEAGVAPAGYSATGLPVGESVEWVLGSNATFRLLGGGGQFRDARQDMLMRPVNWSAPAPFNGPCAAASPAQSVPTSGSATLVLLSLAVAGCGVWGMCRRASA